MGGTESNLKIYIMYIKIIVNIKKQYNDTKLQELSVKLSEKILYLTVFLHFKS